MENKRAHIVIWLVLLAIITPLCSVAKQKAPQRLFSSLANTPNITIIYISESALRGGIRIPNNSAVNLSLSGSTLTSFEMVKSQFDGKEKKAIVRLANDIISHSDFSLLTEVQDGFDSRFTRIYYVPDSSNSNYAKQVFIFQSSNSFGATLINITGHLDITKLFRADNLSSQNLSLNDYLNSFQLLFGF